MYGGDALILGHLLFQVPPLAIRIRKGNITFRWKPLRTKESIAVKSGNGECMIEIDLAFVGFHQIRDTLSNLIALWKKVPFCFVENAYIRENMIPNNPDESMALCLESLVMDAVAGKPNVVYATLITRWFNYKPFSGSFWFRRDWKPIGNRPQQEPVSTSQVAGTPTAGITPTNGQPEQTTTDSGALEQLMSQSIVDLSAIATPEVLRAASPAEVRIPFTPGTSDPGDPRLKPTFPVVYPFNSQPFLNYINYGNDAPQVINGWTDNLTMKWRSFVRLPVPRPRELPSSPARVVQSPPMTQRFDLPPAVTGDRDVILFMGDSICVGFTGMSGQGGTNNMQGASNSERANAIEINQWNPESDRFTAYMDPNALDGFTVYVAAQAGVGSSCIKLAWDRIKSDSNFKRTNNGDRLAAVVLHTGTNDGVTSSSSADTQVETMRNIMEEVKGMGSIGVLLPLPPLSNDPPDGSDRIQQYSAAGQGALDLFVRKIIDLANSDESYTFVDYHLEIANQTFGTGYKAPYKRAYQNYSDKINLHPTPAGSKAMGLYISRNLPLSSMRGIEPAVSSPPLWTVCHVEDGDTLYACNGSDLRVVRLDHIDCLETGHTNITYDMPEGGYTNEQIAEWLPEAQDSWRPAEYKYGALAKQFAENFCQNQQVEITFNGTDSYDRHLGVVKKGDTILNIELVRHGLAYYLDDAGDDNGTYTEALYNAGGGNNPSDIEPSGIWSMVSIPLSGYPDGMPADVINMLERTVRPTEFRQSYPFGGSSNTGRPSLPENCCQ
jgi:endonuclease YncB( thermonuclease family)